ncbi:hypothetical protein [Croceicoccus naphthovorans]|uniref:hypothetical protein n=1 Tax=Croceicoccus naphthovorans TaxID=1348774 RepID=UPI0012E0065B|nr:hypothetical protein [Croceicoccus naphthovorans]MBB3991067.1 hypothetical protein [Croceicoccus naphthovorans]MCB2075946.1 hypothetical protein [Novosphingobium sp.]
MLAAIRTSSAFYGNANKMNCIKEHAAGAEARRLEIERMIARYPELEGEELNRTLSYLKREASAMDQAMIASNPDIMRQYRQLSRDHYLDRLRPSQLALATIVALVIVVALILAVILL